MSYAHAVNIVQEGHPDLTPMWLSALCNADLMKRLPHFAETFGLQEIYVRPDGTLVEMVEDV